MKTMEFQVRIRYMTKESRVHRINSPLDKGITLSIKVLDVQVGRMAVHRLRALGFWLASI